MDGDIDIPFNDMLVYYEPTLYVAVVHLQNLQDSCISDEAQGRDCDDRRVRYGRGAGTEKGQTSYSIVRVLHS